MLLRSLPAFSDCVTELSELDHVSNVLSHIFTKVCAISYATMHAGTFNQLWETLTGTCLLYLGLDWWLFLYIFVHIKHA